MACTQTYFSNYQIPNRILNLHHKGTWKMELIIYKIENCSDISITERKYEDFVFNSPLLYLSKVQFTDCYVYYFLNLTIYQICE